MRQILSRLAFSIGLSADPNFQRPNRHTPVQWAVWCLFSKMRCHDPNSFRYHSEAEIEVLKTLVRFGAKLPSDEDTGKQFRSVLLGMDWYPAFELLKELKALGFAPDELWGNILRHPKIRVHFRLRANALKKLFPALECTK